MCMDFYCFYRFMITINLCLSLGKFEDAKEVIDEEQSIQWWPKGQTTIYKAMHRKLKNGQHAPANNFLYLHFTWLPCILIIIVIHISQEFIMLYVVFYYCWCICYCLGDNLMYLKISRQQLQIWWSQIEFTGDA